MNYQRRAALRQLGSVAAGAATSGLTLARAADQPSVDVAAYGAKGDGTSNDSGAVQRCINESAASGKKVRFGNGVYLLASIELPSNTTIEGSGGTVLKQLSGANDLLHTKDPGSESADANTRSVTLRNLTLQGTVAKDGFQEVLHLMFTQGVSDLRIEGVKFSGFRGDGLYIGTGNERGQNRAQVRHNARVWISGCTFDGETKQNRNGISIIDCDGATIEGCMFTRCTKPNMPGCIDIEPDSSGNPGGTRAIVKNIVIRNNRFVDNNGAGVISINLPNPQQSMTSPVQGIQIVENQIDSAAYDHSVGISIAGLHAVDGATAPCNIQISRNQIRRVSSPFVIQGVRGVRLEGNVFAETRYSASIGSANGKINATDISIAGNRLERVAQDNRAGGNAVFVYNASRIEFIKNTFVACGKADNSYNANIVLAVGPQSAITINENQFISPVPNRNAWDVRHDSGSLERSSARHSGNRLQQVNGGSVGFP